MSINRSLLRIAQEGVIQTLEEKDKEIERLKDLCDKYEEEHKTTFEEWKKAINIIKEVREYIETFEEITGITNRYDYRVKEKLLDIVNKALGSDKE